MRVYNRDDITFIFRDGTEVKADLGVRVQNKGFEPLNYKKMSKYNIQYKTTAAGAKPVVFVAFGAYFEKS